MSYFLKTRRKSGAAPFGDSGHPDLLPVLLQRQAHAQHGQHEEEDPGHLAAHDEGHDKGKDEHERGAYRRADDHHVRELDVGDVRGHARDERGGEEVVDVLEGEALHGAEDVVPEVLAQAAGGGGAGQARERAEEQRERRHEYEQSAEAQYLVHTAAGLYLVDQTCCDERYDALHDHLQGDEDRRDHRGPAVLAEAVGQ